MGDFALLQAYANRRSEEAFTELVNRNINLVYSAALRQMRDPQAAAEVVQTVFIILARKAHTIREGAVLAGWLLRATRFTAANARRREQRRHFTEHQAMDNLYATETGTDWNQIAPLLDEALVALGEQDRNAIVLRFFQQKSYKEVGDALSLSEDGARKRVSRALERLRTFFNKRGRVVATAALAGAISEHAVKAAPHELAGAAVVAALSSASVAPSFLPLLTRMTLETVNWLRWKTTLIGAAAVGLALGVAVLSTTYHSSERTVPTPTTTTEKPQVSRQNTEFSQHQAVVAVQFQRAASANQRSLLFSVVNSESGKPVADARLTLTWHNDSPHRLTNTFVTDKRGECPMPIDRTPVENWNTRIEVFKNGFVPKYVSWSAWQGDKIEDIPLEYKAMLAPAVDIGGSVINEKGEPIPDVRVVFSVPGAAPGGRERLTMMGHYHTEITDAQGHWHCNHVPSQFGMIDYELMHPEYVKGFFGAAAAGATSSGNVTYVAEADLRNDSAVFVLKHGLVVTGVVVDESGNPVADARVTENNEGREPTENQLTESDGSFRFANASGEELTISVRADGFASVSTLLHPSEKAESVRVQMAKEQPLEGRVVDEAGNPVAKARIGVEGQAFEWSTVTDAQGRFEWLAVPTNQVTYSIQAGGYESKYDVALEADGNEHLVTLHASAAVAHEERDDNYQPAQSAEVGSIRADPESDFRLKPSGDISGVIQLPDGTPSVGATVMLCGQDGHAYMKLPAEFDLPDSGNTKHTETDAAGRFSFKPELGVEKIRVAHMAGYAEVSLDELARSRIIVLHPWGRVEGILKIGSEPGRNEQIKLGIWYWRSTAYPHFQLHLETMTDANGHFVFEGVPPGDREVSHSVNVKPGKTGPSRGDAVPVRIGDATSMPVRPWSGQSQTMLVQVQPGQTAHVVLGGAGRTVVGRIKANDPSQNIDWQKDVQTIRTKVSRPNAPKREDFTSESDCAAAKEAWMAKEQEFWQSEAGREAQRNSHQYVLLFATEGSFRINDVAPGAYWFKVGVADPVTPFIPFGGTPGEGRGIKVNLIGSINTEIIVPEPGSANESSLVDLGTFELVPEKLAQNY
jgi:RNA polymerase sigma factor (sigma-70 family)